MSRISVGRAFLKTPALRKLKGAMMEDSWKLHHVAYVVKDINKSIAGFQSLGLELMAPAVVRTWGGERVVVRGKPMSPPMQYHICLLKKGTFIVELFQPIGEGYLWTEFLKAHGEGIQHIHFDVADLEKETKKMLEKGHKIIFAIKRPDGSLREAFFDTGAGNVCIALYHNNEEPRFPGYLTPEASAKLKAELNH
jgi:methylmalonyl-CoA/ethylmalonyl-CoA epimerase